MSTQANNFVSLYQVVQSYCSERNEKSLTRFEKYLNTGIEVYSQISIFEGNTINTVRLTLDSNTMVANLPADFIEMIKIGISINGKLWTLTANPNLIAPIPATICDVPIEQADTITDTTVLDSGFWFSPYWNNGQWYQPLYGVSGGFNTAYYKIDYGNNTIIFSGFTGNYPIILEYKSSGINAGMAIIPRTAMEAIKAGIDYFSKRHDIRYNEGQIASAERRYNVELYSLQRLNNAMNYNEICDALYSTYKMSPKR